MSLWYPDFYEGASIFYPAADTFGSPDGLDYTRINEVPPDHDDTKACKLAPSSDIHRFTLTGPAMASIDAVHIFARFRNANPSVYSAPHIVAGFYDPGTAAYKLLANTYVPQDAIWREFMSSRERGGAPSRVDPFTTQPWDPALFATYELYLMGGGSGGTRTLCSVSHVVVKGIPAVVDEAFGQPLGLPRGAMSGVQQLFRRPLRVVQLEVPLRYYDVPLLKWITLSHYTGPMPDALGWDTESDKPWRRMRLFVTEKEVDLSKRTLKLRAFVERDVTMRVWDVLVSEESPDPDVAAGMARFHTGGRLLGRASPAWVEDAEAITQGNMYVQPLANNQDKHSAGGTWLERLRTNWLKRSSGVDGLTDLTLVGNGTDGSVIAADADDLIFPATVSPESILFTAGNSGGLTPDTYVEWTTEELHANSVVSLAVYHKDIPTVPYNDSVLGALIQRGVDGLYWDYSAPTVWNVSPVWYPFPKRLDPARDVLSNIDVGPDPTTLVVGVGVSSTVSLPLQQNRLYSASLVDGRNAGTPLVSDEDLVHGFADDLRFASTTGKGAWNPEHGHVFCEVVPEWASADLADGDERVVCEIYYPNIGYWIETVDLSEEAFSAHWFDDADFDRVSYIKGTGWRFRRRRAGVNTDAVLAGAVTAGQELKIAATWTGPQGEQDRAPYTLSVYVDGVQGTDAIAAGKHDPLLASASLTVGSSQRWRPTDLSGCVLWFEADNGVQGPSGGVFRDDNVIVGYTDLSGNGNDLQTGGLPKFFLDGPNGLPCVRLDGVADYLFVPDLNLAESHWFLVVKLASITDSKYLLGHDAGGTSQGDIITASSKYRIRGGAGFADLIGTTLGLAAGAWGILEVIQYAADVQGMHNGVHGAKPAVTAAYSADLQIGANGGADFKALDIYGGVVFDRVLRMDEARLPLRYFGSKCALSPLGASHRPVFNHFDGKIRHFRVGDVVPFSDELGDMP